MIYHFCSISPYILKYVQFLKDNSSQFNLGEHFFIILGARDFNANQDDFRDLQHTMVYSKWGFIRFLNKIKNTDALLIHGLSNPRLVLYLYCVNKNLVKRTIWSIWGWDVYCYRYSNTGLKNKIIEYFRQKVIPNIPIITSLVKGDYKIVQDVYHSHAKYIYSYYPIPIDNQIIHNEKVNKNSTIRTIMVGNSGDPSNNHIETLTYLSKFKDKDIRILCPLSYGDINHINAVIEYGKNIFGTNFIPLTQFIPPEEYRKILLDVDVAIMNHYRQQGLGSIINLLCLDKKVFIRSDTTSYNFFLEKGIIVFDTKCIAGLTFDNLLVLDVNVAQQNRRKATVIFSNEEAVKGWREVFMNAISM